jgi:asparagine synthase (glutamine-hydrolysing)
MCGISGIVDLSRGPDEAMVKAMTRALAHRGPDGEGVFADNGAALGSRRLAVIDLSDAGLQPMASADDRLHIVHNGEVYNYRELRSELEANGHGFRTNTDTEVVLAAYRHWGEDCTERFNGMWAFAIWDSVERRLFCSRDRFGVKPFYYLWDGVRLVFASEPKAFLAAGLRLGPNLEVIRDYLEQAYLDHTDGTFFAGLKSLAPRHSLTLDAHGLRIRPYWQLEPRPAELGDAAEAVRSLFVDSVRLRLRSDVTVGTCLSGGLDSSAVAGVVDHLLRTEAQSAEPVGPRQQTFTAYFPDRGFDERPYAEQVVARTNADAHWVTFEAERLVDDLPSIIETQDEPFGSTSMAAQWYVMREARRAGVTVVLDGQGGDEVLAGYRAYVGFYLADLLTRGRVRELGAEVRAFSRVHGRGPVLVSLGRPFAPERLTRAIRARTRGSAPLVHAELRGHSGQKATDGSAFPSRLRRHQALLLGHRGLPELLRYEDRNSMAHSIEARVPFLDYRLVELLFALPSEELLRRGRTKDVLRRALADLLPPAVAARTDKVGFVTPERRWLRGALGDLAADVFASRAFAERGFVDAGAARKRLDQHRRGALDAGMELWRALNLELWARRFLDRAPAG